MKTAAFAVTFVFMMEYSLADIGETFRIEKETEGTTDILRVKDSSGKLLAVIDVHDDGFQLIKPESEDDHVCLILPAFSEETEMFKCYKRVPFPRDEYNADEFAECGNREIFALQPQFNEYCSNNDDGNSKGELREKREVCFWQENIVSKCVREEKYCVRYGWWTGRNTCKLYSHRCAEYQSIRVRDYVCY